MKLINSLRGKRASSDTASNAATTNTISQTAASPQVTERLLESELQALAPLAQSLSELRQLQTEQRIVQRGAAVFKQVDERLAVDEMFRVAHRERVDTVAFQ